MGVLLYQYGGGAFEVRVRYDDTTLDVNRITCANDSLGAGAVLFTRTVDEADPGRARPSHEMTSPEQSGSLFVAVETTAALRIRLVRLPNGKLDGLEGWISWDGSSGAQARGVTVLGGHPPERRRVTAADAQAG